MTDGRPILEGYLARKIAASGDKNGADLLGAGTGGDGGSSVDCTWASSARGDIVRIGERIGVVLKA